jgi:hypothetical protein
LRINITQLAIAVCKAADYSQGHLVISPSRGLCSMLASEMRATRRGERIMEVTLIIALVGWTIAGVNLLLTYDRDTSADLRNVH